VKELIAFPILTLILVVQTAVIARTPLLGGYADLMLVVLAAWALQDRVTTAWHWALLGGAIVGFVSGLPWIVPVIGYLLVVGLARVWVYRIWQAPLLVMFAVVFVGTLFMHILSVFLLRLLGNPLPVGDVFGLVTLPSLLLNLLLAIPVFAMMRDLAGWMYPIEEQV